MAGIKKGTAKNISERKEIERVNPDYRSGLSEEQVRERLEEIQKWKRKMHLNGSTK